MVEVFTSRTANVDHHRTIQEAVRHAVLRALRAVTPSEVWVSARLCTCSPVRAGSLPLYMSQLVEVLFRSYVRLSLADTTPSSLMARGQDLARRH